MQPSLRTLVILLILVCITFTLVLAALRGPLTRLLDQADCRQVQIRRLCPGP